MVEVTSEEKSFPVESVFNSGDGRGWRAPYQGANRFGWFSISRKGSSVYRSCLRIVKLHGHRSSFCGGLRMKGVQSGKLCANSGTSVHLFLYERWRNIKWIFQPLVYWS